MSDFRSASISQSEIKKSTEEEKQESFQRDAPVGDSATIADNTATTMCSSCHHRKVYHDAERGWCIGWAGNKFCSCKGYTGA